MNDQSSSQALNHKINALRGRSRGSRVVVEGAGPIAPAAPRRRQSPQNMATRTRLVVAIPSANRPEILPDTVRAIARQDVLPDLVVLSLSTIKDIGDLVPESLPFPVEIVLGPKGATYQRNRVLRLLGADEIALMIDDDFLMAPDFVRRTIEVFERNADVVLVTGTVLADGIHGPGYDHPTGRELLTKLLGTPARDTLKSTYSGYGCNFALRASVIIEHGLEFDETLPLYSWLEDVDFSRQIAVYGKLVKAGALRGVHLGTKTGRTPGVMLGYSQIANPIYLWRKGTMSLRHAAEMMVRNSLSNLFHAIRPPEWADFRGRLRGNLLALADLARGRVSPQRVLELTP